jgi:hypothetical protein
MSLEFTEGTVADILRTGFVAKPKYMGGAGPVNIKVIDPLKVPNAKFELVLRERTASNNTGLRDSMTRNTGWFLVKKDSVNGNDTIFSDTTIGIRFETIQGRAGKYNATKETLADWGLSIEINQVYNPAENATADPTNSFINWDVKWADNGKQWLTAVVDNDASQGFNNWIRSGNAGRGGTFNGYTSDFLASDGNPLDPGQAYERIWNGRIAPYGLTAREKYSATTTQNTYGFAWSGNTTWLQNPLAELNSFQLVITPDKSKWTRAVVMEMGDDEVKSGTEGNMSKFNMRFGTSKDQNFADEAGSQGLSWFPGYAINLETGERLNIGFGEDSYLPGENGRDMIWNPTSTVYNDNGNYPAIGGKHFIFFPCFVVYRMSQHHINSTWP